MRKHGGGDTVASWLRRLWRGAGWPARGLFATIAALFLFRATFYQGRPRGDRAGFHAIAAGYLDRVPFRDRGVNTYPPTFAAAMVPLELARRAVGDAPVRLAWGVGQLAALAYASFAFASLFAPALGLGGLALAWLAAWRYVVSDLNNQNVTLFLVAVVAAALRAFASGREGRAGALLAAGALVKVWPGVALLPLLAAPRRRALRSLAGAAAAALAGVAASAAVLGPAALEDGFRFWSREVAPHVGGPALLNQSFRGVSYRLLVAGADLRATTTPPSGAAAQRARDVALALGGAVFTAVVALAWLRRARRDRDRALDAILVALALLPALPLTWVHYLALALPILLAVAGAEPIGDARWRRLAVALALAGTALGGVLDVDVVGARAWRAAAFYGNGLAALLLLLGAGLATRAGWRSAEAEGLTGRRGIDAS